MSTQNAKSAGNSWTGASISANGTRLGLAESTAQYGSASIALSCDQNSRLEIYRGATQAAMPLMRSQDVAAGEQLTLTVPAPESFFRISLVNLTPTQATSTCETFYYADLVQGVDNQTGTDVTVLSGGLPGVLMYGRNESGARDLTALDVNNGRLHVNCEELTSMAPQTNRSSLPAMQICGDKGGGFMRTLRVDDDGYILTRPANVSTQLLLVGPIPGSAQTVTAGSTFVGDWIDTTGFSKGTFVGSWNGAFTEGSDKVSVEVSDGRILAFPLMDLFVDNQSPATVTTRGVHTFQEITSHYMRIKVTNAGTADVSCLLYWHAKR